MNTAVLAAAAAAAMAVSPTPTPLPTHVPHWTDAVMVSYVTITAVAATPVAMVIRWDENDPKAIAVQPVGKDYEGGPVLVCRVTTRPDKPPKDRGTVGGYKVTTPGFWAQPVRAPRKGEAALLIRVLPWGGHDD